MKWLWRLYGIVMFLLAVPLAIWGTFMYIIITVVGCLTSDLTWRDFILGDTGMVGSCKNLFEPIIDLIIHGA